ncbi:MAG: hypothetical protein PHC53_00455 [Patescibacteria group bacterium]|nr:hypothetical protein [Patescibacteria group bacterium]
MKKPRETVSRLSDVERQLAEAEKTFEALKKLDIPQACGETRALVKKYSEVDDLLNEKKTEFLIQLCFTLEHMGKKLMIESHEMDVEVKEGGIGVRRRGVDFLTYPGFPELVRDPNFPFTRVCETIMRWIEAFARQSPSTHNADLEFLQKSLAKMHRIAKDLEPNSNAAGD